MALYLFLFSIQYCILLKKYSFCSTNISSKSNNSYYSNLDEIRCSILFGDNVHMGMGLSFVYTYMATFHYIGPSSKYMTNSELSIISKEGVLYEEEL